MGFDGVPAGKGEYGSPWLLDKRLGVGHHHFWPMLSQALAVMPLRMWAGSDFVPSGCPHIGMTSVLLVTLRLDIHTLEQCMRSLGKMLGSGRRSISHGQIHTRLFDTSCLAQLRLDYLPSIAALLMLLSRPDFTVVVVPEVVIQCHPQPTGEGRQERSHC